MGTDPGGGEDGRGETRENVTGGGEGEIRERERDRRGRRREGGNPTGDPTWGDVPQRKRTGEVRRSSTIEGKKGRRAVHSSVRHEERNIWTVR